MKPYISVVVVKIFKTNFLAWKVRKLVIFSQHRCTLVKKIIKFFVKQANRLLEAISILTDLDILENGMMKDKNMALGFCDYLIIPPTMDIFKRTCSQD